MTEGKIISKWIVVCKFYITLAIFCSQPLHAALLDAAYSIPKSLKPGIFFALFFPLPFSSGTIAPEPQASIESSKKNWYIHYATQNISINVEYSWNSVQWNVNTKINLPTFSCTFCWSSYRSDAKSLISPTVFGFCFIKKHFMWNQFGCFPSWNADWNQYIKNKNSAIKINYY